jgi:hypothetical protein
VVDDAALQGERAQAEQVLRRTLLGLSEELCGCVGVIPIEVHVVPNESAGDLLVCVALFGMNLNLTD